MNSKEVQRDTLVHWVKPVLVGQFEQSNKRTHSGKIRHPVILIGIREDKKPEDVKPDVAEVPVGENTLEVDGHSIALSNLAHKYWHDITKADIIQYYIKVWPYIQRYLYNRPLGIQIVKGLAIEANDQGFLRNVAGLYPEWATIYQTDRKHKKIGKSNKIDWLVCNDLSSLVYIANMGSIDIHPWNSNIQTPFNPDYIVIDLDPSDDDFSKSVETAMAAKQHLDDMRLKAFIKTSGKTGIHILIPCTGISNEKGRRIGEYICKDIHELLPDITTLTVSKNSRGNKVFVDFSQNDYADRIAATLCVRSFKVPNVSTPLDWKELKPSLSADIFNIHTIFRRLEKKADPFEKLFSPVIRRRNTEILRGFS